MQLSAEQVAQYLKERPEFFEQYAELLANITLPHPHGGRAIPITERQILSLREKSRTLEAKLKELIQFGEENDSISERLHRVTRVMMMARSLESLLHALYFNLREDFSVPHVALRIFYSGGPELPEFQATREEVREFAQSLAHPHCGPRQALDTLSWFGEAGPLLKSFAYVGLCVEKPLGLLILASEDPQRFYSGMGTLYLKRLGELLSAALERCLG
jgi:uncharacterized protein